MPPEAERRHKHEQVVALLDAHGLEAVLLSRRCNFAWYTGGARNYVGAACDAGNSHLLVDRDGACVLTTTIEATRLTGEDLADTDIGVRAWSYADPAERESVLAKAVGGRRVAADVPVAGLAAEPLDPAFDRLRWTLTETEIARYRSVAADVTAAIETVCRRVEPGWTEDAVAGEAAGQLRRRGCLPWVLLVGADERLAAHRHPLPTANPVERYVMVASCAERGGLIAACSRLVSFGPISDDLAARHRAVMQADAALIGATRPGATLGAIFDAARAAYADAGYPDEWRLHHQGGSIGYLPREVKASPGCTVEALAGQAFAWNPTVAGTKCEDTILCTASGPELLARPTDWPTERAEWQGVAIDRPLILER